MNIWCLAFLAVATSIVLSAGAKDDGKAKSSRLSFSEGPKPNAAAVHTHKEFRFTVLAPVSMAAPLFGANEERKWATGWEPQFLQPLPARDELGAVFTVQHRSGKTATWVMTAADFAGGHVQYVYVIPDVMTTLVDIHLTSPSVDTTAVQVIYERTALRVEGNEDVEHFSSRDAEQGPEWEAQIAAYLKSVGKNK